MNVPADDRFAAWRRREPIFLAALPFCQLAIGLLISVLAVWPNFGLTLAIVVAVALWELYWWTLHVQWHQPGWRSSVYFIGVLLAAAALVSLQPWFGIYAFLLWIRMPEIVHGRWRVPAVLATGAVMSISHIGGPANITSDTIWIYLALVGMNCGVAAGFLYFSEMSEEQSAYRLRTIDEMTRTNDQLQAALDENAGLHVQLLTQAREAGINDERQRMAREIHDTIAQGLTGIITQLEAADQSTGPEQRQRHLDLARGLARDSLGEARRSVQALRPEALENGRLADAVSELASSWSETSTVPTHVEVTGDPVPLLADLEVTLYRVVQESLANVAQHANARRAVITLSYMDSAVSMDVRDDGLGFDPQHHPKRTVGRGFGLTAMRQRVQQVGGELVIESAPGSGTAISATLPAFSSGAVR